MRESDRLILLDCLLEIDLDFAGKAVIKDRLHKFRFLSPIEVYFFCDFLISLVRIFFFVLRAMTTTNWLFILFLGLPKGLFLRLTMEEPP